MALIVADRVKQESSTTGTGNFTLSSGVDGFQSFSAVCSTNDTMYYCIQDKVGTDFEIGHGTFNGSGQLERTNVLQSSNSDNAVDFSSGAKEVFITYPADKAVFQNYNGSITIPSTIDGRDLQTDGTKLDGIEASATADQTATEIRTLVESATDSNVFTDADHTKLNGVEASATADQTGAEIKSAYEGEADTNAFTDTLLSKLNGIEASATADQTDAEIRTAVEAATDSNVFTDTDHTKLNGIEASADVTDTANVTSAGALMDSEVTNLAEVKSFSGSDYATAAQGTLATNALPKAGGTMTGDLKFNDAVQAKFGDSEDLKIYHDGNHSRVADTGTGNLKLQGNDLTLNNANDSATYLGAVNGGAVSLYHNNSLKAQTTSSSWLIKAGNDLRLESGTWTGETSGKIQRHANHMYFQIPDAGTFIYRNQSGSEKLTIQASNGNLVSQGNLTAYSDIRLKEDIKTIDNALDKVSKLRGVEYTRKETKEREIGVIAQEVKEIVPELVDVKENTDSLGEGMLDIHVMKYQNTVGLLIEAIKELKAEIEKLKGN